MTMRLLSPKATAAKLASLQDLQALVAERDRQLTQAKVEIDQLKRQVAKLELESRPH